MEERNYIDGRVQPNIIVKNTPISGIPYTVWAYYHAMEDQGVRMVESEFERLVKKRL